MGFLQSAGLTLLDFALVISVVVFFHELGHLVVGKKLGVKAVRFSLGFGPKIAGFKWGETEYRLSALPLGGYVKFAGDNPYEEVAPEDRGRGFLEQPAWKRGVIAFAGPAANLILAVALSFIVFAAPHEEPAAAVGYVKPGSPAAAAGLLPGDRVTAIDGKHIEGWAALQDLVRAHVGEPLDMTVLRDGREQTLRIVPAVHEEDTPIERIRHGRIGISPAGRLAEVTVTGPDTPAARAGVETFDKVVRLDGQPVATWEDFARRLEGRSAPLRLEVVRRQPVDAAGSTLWSDKTLQLTVAAPPAPGAYGLEASDLTLFQVLPGSAAAEAGLRRGDRILTVAGHPALSWTDEVEGARQAAKFTPLPMTVRRDGREVAVTVRQHAKDAPDELGVKVPTPELGAMPDNLFTEPERVTVTYPLPEALRQSVLGTVSMVRGQVLGIASMISGRISTQAIGGPLMIADVARKAAENGWRTLIETMAAISVVLGIMNLLPVPVLDGFHVLSAAIEAVRRRPLSLRFREVANMVGLGLLLTLMLYALRNDAMKKFFQ